jgi:hypothetical protein
MPYKKIKKGCKIVVEAWSNVVIVYDRYTGEELGREVFNDHIKAVLVAKAL